MEKLMGRHASYYYSFFRIVFGFMFLLHGTQKFLNFPYSDKWSGIPSGMPFVGGTIEIVCGLLILVGFFTSFAAFIASGQMAVAYFMYHQPSGALPRTNGGELAVAYCFAFLYIASRGSGPLSIDSIVRPDKGTTPY
ncbi:MAG: DoxX family protein [Acidobacteria bacterium]|nr:DoxX family protein [Acidobacteriota bacterium]